MRVDTNLASGIMFVVIGLGALIISLMDYQIGTLRQMGPGFFPIIIGSALVVLGLVLVVQALRSDVKTWIEGVNLRSFMPILAGIFAFGILIQPFGLIIALSAMTLIGMFAIKEIRLIELPVIVALQCVLGVGIFVYALGMPLKIWL